MDPKSEVPLVLPELVQLAQLAVPGGKGFPKSLEPPVLTQPNPTASLGGPEPESSAVRPSVVSYFKTDGSWISHSEAMWKPIVQAFSASLPLKFAAWVK